MLCFVRANWATQVTRVSMDRGVGQARKDTVVKLVEGAHRVLLDSLDPLAIRVRGCLLYTSDAADE